MSNQNNSRTPTINEYVPLLDDLFLHYEIDEYVSALEEVRDAYVSQCMTNGISGDEVLDTYLCINMIFQTFRDMSQKLQNKQRLG